MKDYFHLLSVPCSEKLRRCLDASLHICDKPTEERYAQICPRYDGNCSMRYEDGRCGLQMELGEEALSAVCRLYPRGVRTEEDARECSCANSCEATLEALLHHLEPLTFHEMHLQFDESILPCKRANRFETMNLSQKIRLYLIHVMQDRRFAVPLRLLTLGTVLREIADLLEQKDVCGLEKRLAVLAEPPEVLLDQLKIEHLEKGLEVAEAMMAAVNSHSQRIAEYGEAALRWFQRGESPLKQYRIACECLGQHIPNAEIVFEHYLVNHMFFVQFPFQDRPVNICDEQLGLCAIYAILRFLTLGWMAEHGQETDFIDVCAAAFRHIDHTGFDLYGAALLKKLKLECPSDLFLLLCL